MPFVIERYQEYSKKKFDVLTNFSTERFHYGNGSKEELQRMYDSIESKYDDGIECIQMLDVYQTKWTMNLYK